MRGREAVNYSKLHFLPRAHVLPCALWASRAVQFAPGNTLTQLPCSTTKSSGTILNASPEGERHRDMLNNNLHRAKLSGSVEFYEHKSYEWQFLARTSKIKFDVTHHRTTG